MTPAFLVRCRLGACFAVCLPVAASARAQTALLPSGLPDAPEAVRIDVAPGEAWQGAAPGAMARRYALTIQADQTAQPIGAKEKFGMAGRRVFSLGSIASPAISAGYSHALNSAPHFGTDSAGFGERFGAASYRRGVNAFFSTGVFATLFHDDPRYFVLGPGYGLKKRLFYAASRAVITRKDSGGQTVNLPGILGPATAQASAVGFYPSRDRTASRVIGGTFTSIAVNAALLEWSEFGKQIRDHFRHH